jgi:hypothetical protein
VPRNRGGGFTSCVSQDGAGQVYGVKLSVTTTSEESASRLANSFAAAVKAEQRRTGEGKACAPPSSPAISSRRKVREPKK